MNHLYIQTKKAASQLLVFVLFMLLYSNLNAQTEFTTWGNLTGIRVDDQLMEFSTSLVLLNEMGDFRETRKEGQEIDFKRIDDKKIFSYKMNEHLNWADTIQTTGKNETTLGLQVISKVDTLLNGAYFKVELPKEFDQNTQFSIKNPENLTLSDLKAKFGNAAYKAPAIGITIEVPSRKLEMAFATPTELILQQSDLPEEPIVLYVKLAAGNLKADQVYKNTITIRASGTLDTAPATLKIFPQQEGSKFDGMGGNFRLQNPKTDPPVIDYSLKNLRVAWSRIELPWRLWQPDENADPIAEARKGNLDPKVKDAMEMAKRLDSLGIPVILAAWFAPDWAIIGERVEGLSLDGSRGNSLDQTKKEAIYTSLTSYITYLKEAYGVEAQLFSFNESDLGIDVRQTAEEHNILIQELGEKWQKMGLNTRFLLGDTADANGWDFTTPASIDPETRPYIGAVSFHSWRGYTDENLIKWRDIANRVGVPLFVGEGSIDAGAWRYPQIFEEPTYALDEIEIYMKILNLAQPLSILQWQLTADYSVMSGGGLFGNTKDKLHPTQRFFNLKQLGSTPKGLLSIPITIDKKAITGAAFGDENSGTYAIHLVNKGATRMVKLTGIPQKSTEFTLFLTDNEHDFKKMKTLKVKNGVLEFELQGAGYVSLMSN